MGSMRYLPLKLSFLVFSALVAQSPSPSPPIRVPVRLVTAPTLVFSKEGQPIPNLQPGDFRVFDNGRLQQAILDTVTTPFSVAMVFQVNQDVRLYLPYIRKAGTVVERLLLGDSGEITVLAYADDIAVVKPFDGGDVQSGLGRLKSGGRRARMIDAGLRAVTLLKERPRSRLRILIFIGQSADIGSE